MEGFLTLVFLAIAFFLIRSQLKKRKRKQSPHPVQQEKQETQPDLSAINIRIQIGPTEEEKREKQVRASEIYPIAIKTLNLCTGIPEEKKDGIAKAIAQIENSWSPDKSPEFETALQMLQGIEWQWLEWEKWAPICLEHDVYPHSMWSICRPFPDVLDLEGERKKYSPERIFNLMTLATAKLRLKDFPDTVQKLSRAEVIELLKTNSTAWHSVIDPHIQAKWNSKPHYAGPTPNRIFALLCNTVHERYRAMKELNDIARYSNEVLCCTTDNDQLLELVKADKNPLWIEPYGPVIPGMSLYFKPKDINWDRS